MIRFIGKFEFKPMNNLPNASLEQRRRANRFWSSFDEKTIANLEKRGYDPEQLRELRYYLEDYLRRPYLGSHRHIVTAMDKDGINIVDTPKLKLHSEFMIPSLDEDGSWNTISVIEQILGDSIFDYTDDNNATDRSAYDKVLASLSKHIDNVRNEQSMLRKDHPNLIREDWFLPVDVREEPKVHLMRRVPIGDMIRYRNKKVPLNIQDFVQGFDGLESDLYDWFVSSGIDPVESRSLAKRYGNDSDKFTKLMSSEEPRTSLRYSEPYKVPMYRHSNTVQSNLIREYLRQFKQDIG